MIVCIHRTVNDFKFFSDCGLLGYDIVLSPFYTEDGSNRFTPSRYSDGLRAGRPGFESW
jgi:hypothetical protein